MTVPRPRRAVTVRISDIQPCCPRCGQQVLLSADLPHGWDNPDGTRTSGTIPVGICERCDASDPAAGALITYFQVHGQVDASSLHEFAGLAQAWADGVAIPPLDTAALEDEIRAWKQGEL
jgi:hypothetical protein